jgi:hypothetical protein
VRIPQGSKPITLEGIMSEVTRRGVLKLAAAAGVSSAIGGAAVADEANKPAGAPPEKDVKGLLEQRMWAPPAQGGTKHTYNYRFLKYAPSRKGEYRTDGVPANRDTIVYPIKVSVEIIRKFTDGTERMEEKKQSYVFFKDEFGDWTFRFLSND